MLILETLDAKKGDCFLLHIGGEGQNTVLFDGGPAGVWNQSLRPRLEELADGDVLTLALMIVSHIDDDHIRGMLDMTNRMLQQDADFVEIGGRWFNSFRDITQDIRPAALAARENIASASNWTTYSAATGADDERAQMIVASVRQGDRLTENLANPAIGLPNNDGAGADNLIKAGMQRQIGGATLHVIGPLPDQLEDLHQKWKRESDEATIAQSLDRSIPNLSSIAVLVKSPQSKILMTGDARHDFLLQGLEQGGHLDANGAIHVDILKLPHHGSNRNVNPDFFAKVKADTYIISADGSHHNPDADTLEWLVHSRADQDNYELLFSTKMKKPQLQADLDSTLRGLQAGRAFTVTYAEDDPHKGVRTLS